MRTTLSKISRPAFHTITEVSWLLGTTKARVSRAIRCGDLRAVWRRGRLTVSAAEVARVLGGAA